MGVLAIYIKAMSTQCQEKALVKKAFYRHSLLK